MRRRYRGRHDIGGRARSRTRSAHLHETGCFVMPNPWDVGSARYLASLGFKALATTSSGFAWSLGRSDNAVTLDEALGHMTSIAASVDLPINADFEGGFAIEPDGVAANVARAVTTGIAGISIEDSTGDADDPLFEFALAVERVRAARRAIDASGTRRPADRSIGGLHRRAARSRRDDPAAHRLRRGRRRLPLRAGSPVDGGHHGRRRRGRPETGQRARRERLHGRSPSSPTPASAGSASVARSRGPRGAASSAPPPRSPSTGRSRPGRRGPVRRDRRGIRQGLIKPRLTPPVRRGRPRTARAARP